MRVADDAHIGMAKDGGSLILIDGHDVASFANARDMLRGPANAQREIQARGYGAPRQADLLLFGEPTLVGHIAPVSYTHLTLPTIYSV